MLRMVFSSVAFFAMLCVAFIIIVLIVTYYCHAECRSAECRYVQRHGTLRWQQFFKQLFKEFIALANSTVSSLKLFIFFVFTVAGNKLERSFFQVFSA
jgi:hypothetical protein